MILFDVIFELGAFPIDALVKGQGIICMLLNLRSVYRTDSLSRSCKNSFSCIGDATVLAMPRQGGAANKCAALK